jgi:hypothetical protein
MLGDRWDIADPGEIGVTRFWGRTIRMFPEGKLSARVEDARQQLERLRRKYRLVCQSVDSIGNMGVDRK